MVPPGDIGALPLWVGVFVLLGIALAVFHYAFYTRVVRLVLQGKATARFPPRKNVAASPPATNMLINSARKNIEKVMPEYSV